MAHVGLKLYNVFVPYLLGVILKKVISQILTVPCSPFIGVGKYTIPTNVGVNRYRFAYRFYLIFYPYTRRV